MEGEVYDTIILGGGPAGAAAAIYSARKQMKTMLIATSFGGQSIVSDDIQNWIGDPHISGVDLAKKLEAHVRSYSEIEVKVPEKIIEIKTTSCKEGERFCDFEVVTDQGRYLGKTIIICLGSRRRHLGIPGEDKFEGKGVSFCPICDAPLFKNKKVAVVGGGNAGLEAVSDLTTYASEIYLLANKESLNGDEQTQEKIKQNPKLKEVILNAKVLEIMGDNVVNGIKYQSSSEEKTLLVDGVFVEIGSQPNSEIVKNLIQLDDKGQIIVNPRTAATLHPGVYAAGDITDDPFKQNMISAADAIKAALSAHDYLKKRQTL